MSGENETHNKKTSVSAELFDPGTIIAGRYKIQRLIGNGGMAAVYLAEDQQNGVLVAVKMLHREFASDKTYLERFIREVQYMDRVDHPNIVKTYDILTDGPSVFFTMEYVDGCSLDPLLDRSSFSVGEIMALVIGICEGLEVIHQHQIVHRDLKPGNVLLTQSGLVKITDFGVAREKEASRLTAKTQKVGSMCYMAPEIWLGKTPTAAVDFYSLGILMYELATGEIPFEDEYPGTVMAMHLDQVPRPPRELNPAIPAWLSDYILRLLAKSPKDRPQSAKEIADYIRKHLLGKELVLEQKSLAEKVHAISALVDSLALNTATNEMQSPSAKRLGEKPRRGRTYVFKLTATKILDEANLSGKPVRPRRKATVILPLPRRAAIVFEIEAPSRDFIYFGVFLASLQIFDGVLTSMGMSRFSLEAEGNPLLRELMLRYGPENALFAVKGIAICMVVFLTFLAKRQRWIKDMIAALSCLYLFAAIVPWVYFLYR